MFPRIQKTIKNGVTYQYLVVSESVRLKGKGSTTKNIANLGNIKSFNTADIQSLIDGFIKIFQLEQYASTDDIEITESLEYGSILLWQKIWNDLNLSGFIRAHLKKKLQLTSEVEKYVEIMVVNRCNGALSKLGVSRWVDTTCYKVMKGYENLSHDVNSYYRSMDHLLSVKNQLEKSIFDKLSSLFSINVRMSFYDITSTFFYSDRCPLSAHGYSRDNRPDREQIIVGVVTSYEGYPVKHYVFKGNTKDETTVQEVIDTLKKEYNIEETLFVGDRGMITKLNIESLMSEGYDYIMGVKARQDEIIEMAVPDCTGTEEYTDEYRGLKLREKRIEIKEFLVWKINEILKNSEVKIPDDSYMLCEKIMNEITGRDSGKSYSKIFKETVEGIDSKTCQKLNRLIKKYEGQYDNELRYIISLNSARKEESCRKRNEHISKIAEELSRIFSEAEKKDQIKIERSINRQFEGYRGKYRKFFEIKREGENRRAVGYCIDRSAVESDEKLDGVFILRTNRFDIENKKVVESYKNLQEVEILFDDFKNFVDVRPIRHWLEDRVRSHVFICILALLLKRVFEINCLEGKAVTEPLEQISKVKLVQYKVKFSKKEERYKSFQKTTRINSIQKEYFNKVGIKKPENLEKFVW